MATEFKPAKKITEKKPKLGKILGRIKENKNANGRRKLDDFEETQRNMHETEKITPLINGWKWDLRN